MFDDQGFFLFSLGKSLGTAIKLLYDTLHALRGLFCRLFLRGDGAIDVSFSHLLGLVFSHLFGRHLTRN